MSDPDVTPLYTKNPLNRFSARAADYARYRPSYPTAAIDTILEGLGSPSQLVAADIGAGTGISSRLLAQREVKVLAIEPNATMRQAAEPHPLVEFRDATAEATALPDRSVDLVTCFQSFHWFNPELTLSEFCRILKFSGRLALVWNDLNEDDEFTANYKRLVQMAAIHLPPDRFRTSVNSLQASPHLTNIQHHTFIYRQDVDLARLLGNARSHSFVPREGLAHQQLISDLQQLHERNCNAHGLVSLVYSTSVFLASPRPY